jgi:hypothetical protein
MAHSEPTRRTNWQRAGQTTGGMEFFCCHQDRPGSADLRGELVEQHWSYMDRYAKQMIARGPTFAAGHETLSGSVRIPRDVLLRRWRNTLGRTMWDFPAGRTVTTGTWCLASAPARPPTSPCRRTGTS